MNKKTFMRLLMAGILFLSAAVLTADGISYAQETETKTAVSKDGTAISYAVYGEGEPALVFIHGWSCDSRYWKEQVPYFSKKYKVITIDLAGHGNSGQKRQIYSLDGFAEDVKAVMDDAGIEKAILIGHSMGGGVMAKAALLMPKRVIGLIGVDNLQNVEQSMDEEQFKAIIDAYKQDFPNTVKNFISEMFAEGSDPALKEWVSNDMSSAQPRVGISAFQEYVSTFNDKGMAKIFDKIKVPVRCVNADLWPVNPEVNREHMTSFDVTVMHGLGHFLMLEAPEEFNKNLEHYVQELTNLNNQE